MISDEDYQNREEEIGQLFAQEPRPDPADDVRRINRIVERALFENVVKDTTSFIFSSFGSALGGLTGAVIGAMPAGEAAEGEESAGKEPEQ